MGSREPAVAPDRILEPSCVVSVVQDLIDHAERHAIACPGAESLVMDPFVELPSAHTVDHRPLEDLLYEGARTGSGITLLFTSPGRRSVRYPSAGMRGPIALLGPRLHPALHVHSPVIILSVSPASRGIIRRNFSRSVNL